VRAYASRASDAGSPLSGGDVLLGALALVALVAAGAGLRLLADRGPEESATAQAGVR
jgi:hypothetical protein